MQIDLYIWRKWLVPVVKMTEHSGWIGRLKFQVRQRARHFLCKNIYMFLKNFIFANEYCFPCTVIISIITFKNKYLLGLTHWGEYKQRCQQTPWHCSQETLVARQWNKWSWCIMTADANLAWQGGHFDILMPAYNIYIYIYIFTCGQAALWMVQSISLSVCLSICLSHLFHYVPIITSSWSDVHAKGQGQRSKVHKGQHPI